MEILIKIDERSKQAKTVLEMLKTFDFVQFMDSDAQEKSNDKELFVAEIAKKVNKKVAKKWYDESGITY